MEPLIPILAALVTGLVTLGGIVLGRDLSERARLRRIRRNWKRMEAEAHVANLADAFRRADLPELPGDLKWWLNDDGKSVTLSAVEVEEDEDGNAQSLLVMASMTVYAAAGIDQAAMDEMAAYAVRKLAEAVEDQCD